MHRPICWPPVHISQSTIQPTRAHIDPCERGHIRTTPAGSPYAHISCSLAPSAHMLNLHAGTYPPARRRAPHVCNRHASTNGETMGTRAAHSCLGRECALHALTAHTRARFDMMRAGWAMGSGGNEYRMRQRDCGGCARRSARASPSHRRGCCRSLEIAVGVADERRPLCPPRFLEEERCPTRTRPRPGLPATQAQRVDRSQASSQGTRTLTRQASALHEAFTCSLLATPHATHAAATT